jgi:hypothetical protein
VDTDEGPVPELAFTGVPAKLYGIELEGTWRVLDGPNVLGMSRTWALEVAPFRITVNMVASGPVQTDMFPGVVPVGDPNVGQIAAGIPVRRLGQPADVAHAARFWVEEAGFVTGQVLYVCGGTSAGTLTLPPALRLQSKAGLTWRIPREGG